MKAETRGTAADRDRGSAVGQSSLYDRIGGRSGAAHLVAKFYVRVLTDPMLEHFFVETDLGCLSRRLIDFLGQILGGPANYHGRTMREAHAHLYLMPQHFARVVEHLSDALRSMNVPTPVVEAVMARIAALEPEIVSPLAEAPAVRTTSPSGQLEPHPKR